MANNHTLRSLFKDIANAIKEKDGTTDDIKASDFPERILNISVSKDLFVEIVTGEIESIDEGDLDGLTSIGDQAFVGCNKLTTVTLPSSITKISKSAFNECNNLKTINVPWASGAVANAPWGATNAIINYNYGG